MLTIDNLIDQLQQLKSDGLPGTTRVGIPSMDNDGVSRMVQLEIAPCLTKVSQADYEEDWHLCRKVVRGGIDVLVLAG